MIPRPIKRSLRRVITATTSGFDHIAAQRYEIRTAQRIMRKTFPELYAQWQAKMQTGSLWQSAHDQWFLGNEVMFNSFVDHVRDRTCLEIGSGPYGYLAPCSWIRNRIVVDPLVDQYRAFQTELCGGTFFTDEVKTYNQPAERVIPELRGKVDGLIVCRNALDHCDDPLSVLNAMSDYAVSGCYLLLWTDIWHLDGANVGHRNITRSSEVMDKLLAGLGFQILQNGSTLRERDEYVEYGRLARKI